MSAFVPTNLLICAGMLKPNPSLGSIIFWQWANQTLNVSDWSRQCIASGAGRVGADLRRGMCETEVADALVPLWLDACPRGTNVSPQCTLCPLVCDVLDGSRACAVLGVRWESDHFLRELNRRASLLST